MGFADAVEESVKDVQYGSTTLKSALASENIRTFQQFMQADPHPRTFTHGTWAQARRDMKIVIDLPFVCMHSLSTFFRSSMKLKPLYYLIPESDLLGPGMETKSSVSYVYQVGIHFRCANIKTEALNALLESTKAVVADMELMEEWWATVINALGNVEDAARLRCIDDNAVMVALNRIIRAMDSYCEAVSFTRSIK